MLKLVPLAWVVGLAFAPGAYAQNREPVTAERTAEIPNSHVHRITADGGRQITLFVQLPDSYRDSTERAYPVLYLTDAEAPLFGQFAGIQWNLRFVGRIRDVVLVGIADGDVGHHFSIRRLDYTPTRVPPEDTRSGGAEAFIRMLEEEVFPFIEARYRVDPHDRGIWGHSLGGLLAAYAVTHHLAIFRRYVISDPTLIWDSGWLVREVVTGSAPREPASGRVYAAIAEAEPEGEHSAFRTFFSALRERSGRGLAVETDLLRGADHLTTIPFAFGKGLVAVYGIRPISAVVDSVIAAEGVEAAIRAYQELRLTEPYEYNFAEPQLNRLGYQLLRRGRLGDAVEVFKLNVEQYPGSSNVYDSLGEAYTAAGDLDAAIANYRRAVELDPANEHSAAQLRELLRRRGRL